MTKLTLLEQISHFVDATPLEKIPQDVIDTAKDGLIDYVAVASAGSRSAVAKNVSAYLNKEPTKGTCVWFGSEHLSNAKDAVLFNGTASHALDFDDVSWATIGHPTVAVAPTCFAMANKNVSTGAELLRAYILAIESMHQIARWTMPQLSERGWHTTPANGVFGSAAAAAILDRLTTQQTVSALAIAASRAGGIRANFGSQTKALHAGLCNLAGVEAAGLAKCGVTGRANALEAADGYFQCFSDLEKANSKFDLGQYWDLRENGLVFKRYPCCSGTHPTLDVLGDFLSEHPLSPEDIKAIRAGVSLLGPKELNCHNPQDCVQAKFSLEFAIAARIIHGAIKVETFTDEKVLDPRIQELMKKVEMTVSPELEKLGFIGTAPIRMEIELKDGSKFNLANDLAMGNPEKPFTPEVKRQKFFDCVSPIAGHELADQWFEILQNISEATAEQVSKIGIVPLERK